MAKICVICTDKIGALTGKIKLSDGNYVFSFVKLS